MQIGKKFRKSSVGARIDRLEARQLLSTTVQVAATDDLWQVAGQTGTSAGTAPVEINLQAGTNRVLTLSGVSGTVSANKLETVVAGPDGYPASMGFTTALSSVGGISGIVDSSHLGDFALLGLFTGSTVPNHSAPGREDYTNLQNNASFSPLVDQTFFIGDGKTSAGVVQTFNIPSGATKLYLGFGDAGGSSAGPFHGTPSIYNDNTGALAATVNISVPAQPFKITGSVLNDLNGTPGQGLAGWRVYVDANKDGQFDAGDLSTVTDSLGNYSLSLPAGTYTIGVEIRNGYAIASPSNFTYTVNSNSAVKTGLDFIVKLVIPAL